MDALKKIIDLNYPDIRAIIGYTQKLAIYGKVTSDNLTDIVKKYGSQNNWKDSYDKYYFWKPVHKKTPLNLKDMVPY